MSNASQRKRPSTFLATREAIKERLPLAFSSPQTLLVAVIILFLLGILDGLSPWLLSSILPPINTTHILAYSIQGLIIVAMAMLLLLLLHQYELLAAIVIAAHLYLDWYLSLHIFALIAALVLLIVFYLSRSTRYPWIAPPTLWLWFLFLICTIYPALRGALNSNDALYYYPNLVLGALLLFWLGQVVARNYASVRRLFQLLAVIGTFVAFQTVLQATTGIFLLRSSNFDTFLATVSNYQISSSVNVNRLGSYLVDPNWNGAFLAFMLFIPLGLFCECSSLVKKSLYLAVVFLIALAVLFTYSAGSWIAILGGAIAFLFLTGRTRYRIQIPLLLVCAALIIETWFPSQISLLIQHGTGPDELSLRVGAWQTALRVIQAFPLTGIGLGLTAYLIRADPYRVPAQYEPLVHPHNAFLEWGAMAGLPVLLIFVALIALALWRAWHNRALADRQTRSLLGGGMAAVITLSINSMSINGWTLPPIAGLAWLTLGAISSPLLSQRGVVKDKSDISESIAEYAS